MYSSKIVFGFHGCDKKTRNKILNKKDKIKSSHNDYDWLGSWVYFWENNPKRALEWAQYIKDNPKLFTTKIKTPAVLGAIIDLGNCLNLLDSECLKLVKKSYEALFRYNKITKNPMPENLNRINGIPLKRNLDNAVIRTTHNLLKLNKIKEFDTVKAAFLEGKDLYPNAGFKNKNHIQIYVRIRNLY